MIDLVAVSVIAAVGGYALRALTHRSVTINADPAMIRRQPTAVEKHAVMIEDDEGSEPFDISLQAFGDHDAGRPAHFMIASAMNGWQRSGCPSVYTHANGIHVHLIVRRAGVMQEGLEP